ncbi:MAG: hypothetical protein ABWZ98_06460 [Nakamurella sp.]
MTMSASDQPVQRIREFGPRIVGLADGGPVGELGDPPIGIRLFDTPQEAALDGWRTTPAAHPLVIAVQLGPSADRVYVTIQTDGHPGFHDRDISLCGRTSDGKWWEIGSFGG